MADGTMGYSMSDVLAFMNSGRKDGFLEGDGLIILILFFLIFGFNGNGFGNGWGNNAWGNPAMQGALTRAELYEGFNNQNVERQLSGITNGLSDGFYAQNTTMLQGFNTIGSQIAENRFAAQHCCCETNRNIDSVKYEAAQNTCAITSNATDNTQKILDRLCQMESAAKDQRIADLTASLQTANYQLSQQAQNATLIRTLKPSPIPAYLTNSPYQSVPYSYGYGYSACGCGGY